MPLRSDILRGIRLFLAAFASMLLTYLAYELLRPTSQVQGAPQAASAPQPGQSQPQAAEPAEESSEPHPLVVPEPPPVSGAAASAAPAKTPRPRLRNASVPPPPPLAPARVVRATKPTAPAPRDLEAPETTQPNPAASETVSQPAPADSAVGYKSLMEADPNRPPAEVEPAAPPAAEPAKKPGGHRIIRALGRVFRLGKKDTTKPQPQP